METPDYRGPIVNGAVDTTRWDRLESRPGDIIVAVADKMGTTWTQMLCALLAHGPELPQPLAELSPWLDGGAQDHAADSVDVLNGQPWRRVIKTHTPLHALKYRQDAVYVTCGRDPRDVFLSAIDHNENDPRAVAPSRALDRDRLFASVLDLDGRRSLAGLFDHVASFWRHRRLPNIVFLHYADLSDDLEGEIGRLASALDVRRSPEELTGLAALARFESMRARADDLAPGARVEGRWKRNANFFRKGRRGEWRDVYSPQTQALYVAATRGRYDGAMLDWLECGRAVAGDPRTL